MAASLVQPVTHTPALLPSSPTQVQLHTNRHRLIAPITPPSSPPRHIAPITPPPTSSASNRRGVIRMTPTIVQTSPRVSRQRPGTGLVNPPPHIRVTSDQRQSPDAQPPSQNTPSQPPSLEQLDHAPPQPGDRAFTPIFPFLMRTGMDGYFRIEDSISYRSESGEHGPSISIIPPLTGLSCSCSRNAGSD